METETQTGRLTALEELAQATAVLRAAEAKTREAVLWARANGSSWREIARTMQESHSTVARRYGDA